MPPYYDWSKDPRMKRDFNTGGRRYTEYPDPTESGRRFQKLGVATVARYLVMSVLGLGIVSILILNGLNSSKGPPLSRLGTTQIPSSLPKPATGNSQASGGQSSNVPSGYARCAGNPDRASCEKLERQLEKETPALTAARQRELDADRERNMRRAIAMAEGSLRQASAEPVAKPTPVTSSIPALPLTPSPERIKDPSCPSAVTLNLQSSNYYGVINVELRVGSRPGSSILDRSSVMSSGVVRFANICPGTYFFAFATPDTVAVSTTRYFQVTQDENRFSNPQITVTYSRALGPDSQRVGSVARNEL